jgi:hypothetical protein
MRKGPPKTRIRWHISYDADYVLRIVEDKVKKTIGMSSVKWIDVDIVAHFTGPRIETKPLQ